MDSWHYDDCQRPDVQSIGGLITCMACGSTDSSILETSSETASLASSFGVESIPDEFSDGEEHESPPLSPARHESLNNLPVYEAISYTWADDSGNQQKNRRIWLGDEPYMVTTSCQHVLRRARLHGKLTVWIDAVCINQEDADERNHQVRLMAQAYANARSVMAYIGEDRPYFWRVWVLQEIAPARKATLVCGDATIPWADFATRIQDSSVFGEAALNALLTRPSPQVTYGFGDAAEKWPFLHNGLGQIDGVPLALSFVAPEFRTIGELPRLLDLSSFCEATDLRDKVYALLGLATGTEEYGFFPDYNTDLEGVYTKTAILIAASCGVLPLLVRAVCRRAISEALLWVPDWRSYSPVSPSRTSDKVSILDEIRQDVATVSGSSLSMDLSTVTSVNFTATPVCTFLDFLWLSQRLPTFVLLACWLQSG
ncbi:heterokaryon incompatibility protein-domain-containing protein [Cercophora newfieldiana]|uniref:Heterokaryon incompatibility protein-domain-containing protein n=1 Tax=Cercophora newfieldiana TaxID=92897 RepID=A0AA39Y8P9_9PEZI|nr:heterokaryon incompatibility protein-domain-containing protein [Cercophora newfieldiana]